MAAPKSHILIDRESGVGALESLSQGSRSATIPLARIAVSLGFKARLIERLSTRPFFWVATIPCAPFKATIWDTIIPTILGEART